MVRQKSFTGTYPLQKRTTLLVSTQHLGFMGLDSGRLYSIRFIGIPYYLITLLDTKRTFSPYSSVPNKRRGGATSALTWV